MGKRESKRLVMNNCDEIFPRISRENPIQWGGILLSHAVIAWIVFAVILGIIEVCSLNMVTLWIAIGAIFAAIAAAFGVPPIAQAGVFVLTSGILVVVTRPLAKKLVPKTEPLNYDRVIGEVGVVIEEINAVLGSGQVKVIGQIWSAKCKSSTVIAIDENVKIVAVEGVRVVVETIENA